MQIFFHIKSNQFLRTISSNSDLNINSRKRTILRDCKILDKRFFEFNKNIIYRKHVENSTKITKKFFQNFKINNNIVNVYFNKFTRT